jgi:hypothetical protein
MFAAMTELGHPNGAVVTDADILDVEHLMMRFLGVYIV